MTLFEKLSIFRRLVGSVPYVRSRKHFYSRLLSCISRFNIDSSYSYINLANKDFPDSQHFSLVDIIEVPASQLQRDIIIEVYACIIYNGITNNLYYKVNV